MTETIQNALLGALGGFKCLLTIARESDDEPLRLFILPKLENELARFKVWSGNSGAHRKGKSSLEHRLRDASHIRVQVLSLLSDLKKMLDEGADILNGELTPWNELDDGENPLDDLGIETEIEQIALDVVEVVDCLFRLSIAIRNPAPHDQFKSSEAEETSIAYENAYRSHVDAKFPNINGILLERLAKAISRRRQYFDYRASHHEKISEGLDANDDTARTETGQSTVASSIPSHMKQETPQDCPFEGVDTHSDTAFSQTSYATSFTSPERLRVPAMPEEALNGPFECPFCFQIIEIGDTLSWKRHVYGDLRPYNCLAEDCTAYNRDFSSRGEWMQHMLQNHFRTYCCPFDCETTFSSAAKSTDHLTKVHSGRVPHKSQAEILVRLSSQPLDPDSCPLCFETIASLKQYRRHVGSHQRDLALFALPKIENENEDEEGDLEVSDGESEASSFQTSPAQAHLSGFQESPYLDNYDYDFGDSSFDFNFTNNQGKMINEIPGSVKSIKSDSTENESSDKRAHPDDEEDDAAPGNGAKRRESTEKVPKKPGRKPSSTDNEISLEDPLVDTVALPSGQSQASGTTSSDQEAQLLLQNAQRTQRILLELAQSRDEANQKLLDAFREQQKKSSRTIETLEKFLDSQHEQRKKSSRTIKTLEKFLDSQYEQQKNDPSRRHSETSTDRTGPEPLGIVGESDSTLESLQQERERNQEDYRGEVEMPRNELEQDDTGNDRRSESPNQLRWRIRREMRKPAPGASDSESSEYEPEADHFMLDQRELRMRKSPLYRHTASEVSDSEVEASIADQPGLSTQWEQPDEAATTSSGSPESPIDPSALQFILPPDLNQSSAGPSLPIPGTSSPTPESSASLPLAENFGYGLGYEAEQTNEIDREALQLGQEEQQSVGRSSICIHCGQIFRIPSELSRHMRIHERPMKCSVAGCDARFSYNKDLARHTNVYHPSPGTNKEKMVCGYCGETFTRKDNLRRHQNRSKGCKSKTTQQKPQQEPQQESRQEPQQKSEQEPQHESQQEPPPPERPQGSDVRWPVWNAAAREEYLRRWEEADRQGIDTGHAISYKDYQMMMDMGKWFQDLDDEKVATGLITREELEQEKLEELRDLLTQGDADNPPILVPKPTVTSEDDNTTRASSSKPS